MARHHAHSHRERRPRRERTTFDRWGELRAPVETVEQWKLRLARLQGRQRRIERRRARLAEGPREVVVQVPGLKATQQRGTPQPPGRGFVSRWIRQSAARRAFERAMAEAAARRS